MGDKSIARVKNFRSWLVNAIPRVPNDRASKLHMQQKQLPELLIDYVNWRSRYVGQRPRTVTVEPATKADPRWSAHAAAIGAFIDKVRRGDDDLTPHLSIKPHTQGYAPAARAPGATTEDRWSDKDFLLNIMGYHHFHLGTAIQKRGHVDRTDDLIFAEVHRDTFKVIDRTGFSLAVASRLGRATRGDANGAPAREHWRAQSERRLASRAERNPAAIITHVAPPAESARGILREGGEGAAERGDFRSIRRAWN